MMRTFLALAMAMLLTCSAAISQNINWYSWDEGYEVSGKENKPMLIFLYAGWCDKCKRMDTKTFKNEEVMSLVKKDFIPIKLDIDAIMKGDGLYKKDGRELTGMELLKTLVPSGPLGIPLNIMVSADYRVKELIEGLNDSEEMKEKLAAYLKKITL